jgi:hypothetical protein
MCDTIGSVCLIGSAFFFLVIVLNNAVMQPMTELIEVVMVTKAGVSLPPSPFVAL